MALSPEEQAKLRAEQRLIQQQLDARDVEAGAVHVPRPAGLAALSSPVGNSNVVTFPLAPRPSSQAGWPGPGGDAA